MAKCPNCQCTVFFDWIASFGTTGPVSIIYCSNCMTAIGVVPNFEYQTERLKEIVNTEIKKVLKEHRIDVSTMQKIFANLDDSNNGINEILKKLR